MNTATTWVDKKKVVYLFGAGATHAELVNLYSSKFIDEIYSEQNGVLISNVSKRVCRDAKKQGIFPKQIEKILSPAGLTNIELFISLIEKNAIKSEDTIEQLKRRIKKDITERLIKSRRKKFYLHRSLLELHQKVRREELIGLISLNYDQVLDEAYIEIRKNKPNYGLLAEGSKGLPLLKLHGGFNLMYEGEKLPIITPGINKNYLELPYNFIWGRALRLLIQCDILRVIGCSLSQNDLSLIELLFKAHLARIKDKKPFLMQIIDFDPKENTIKENYGFLPRIETATEIEGGLISDESIRDRFKNSNPFKIWLKAKIERMIKVGEIKKTRYLKKVLI